MSKIDYKAMYEALIEDIRKHGVIEMCEICVWTYPPEYLVNLIAILAQRAAAVKTAGTTVTGNGEGKPSSD